MRIIKTLFVVMAAMATMPGLLSCGGKKPAISTVAFGSMPATECIGQDPSGAQRLRVWGEGKDVKSAVENARKKAVEEVLFNYITAGTGRFNSMPLLAAPTVRTDNQQYFAKFFKDGGKYKKYIKAEDVDEKTRLYGNDKVMQKMEITVDRAGLQKQLQKDKILK